MGSGLVGRIVHVQQNDDPSESNWLMIVSNF
jgi:hypothetical protein